MWTGWTRWSASPGACSGLQIFGPAGERFSSFPLTRFRALRAILPIGRWFLKVYSIGMDRLKETRKSCGFNYDKKDLDVKVKVGWVSVRYFLGLRRPQSP